MSDRSSQPAEFAAASQRVLALVPDRAFAAKLEIVYHAADACIARLRAIDLARFEPQSEEETADLGMWEQVAPAIGQTLSHVNELNATIQEQFPATVAGGAGAKGVEKRAEKGAEKEAEAAAAIHRSAEQLTQEVTAMGQSVRRPEVVSSRWALLKLLQQSRGRFLSVIGDLVFESAQVFAEVRRAEVVPYHQEMLEEALLLRRSMIDLSRVVALYGEKLKKAVLSEMPGILTQLEKDLGAFSKSRAWGGLWSNDKLELLHRRARLRELAASPPGADPIRNEVATFTDNVAKLGAVNERFILKEHDRELSAQCMVKLEMAEQARDDDPEGAASLVADVIGRAWDLYGRDPELDAFLRQVKKRGQVVVRADALQVEIEQVRTLIAHVPMALL